MSQLYALHELVFLAGLPGLGEHGIVWLFHHFTWSFLTLSFDLSEPTLETGARQVEGPWSGGYAGSTGREERAEGQAKKPAIEGA